MLGGFVTPVTDVGHLVLTLESSADSVIDTLKDTKNSFVRAAFGYSRYSNPMSQSMFKSKPPE